MPEKNPITYPEAVQASVAGYITDLFVQESDVQKLARQSVLDNNMPQIDLRPQEAQFLMWMARSIGAKRILEIGTLAGYSALWLAQALPPDGELITLEADSKHAGIAGEHFQKAGVQERVRIITGNAHETLKTLSGAFDMLFIDAEKDGYMAYLDWGLEHVRPGGLIAAHNALRRGQVTDPDSTDGYVRIMQAFNQRIADEPRLMGTMYPAGDGMVMAIVRDAS